MADLLTPVELLDAYRATHKQCVKDEHGDTRCDLCKMYDKWTSGAKPRGSRASLRA